MKGLLENLLEIDFDRFSKPGCSMAIFYVDINDGSQPGVSAYTGTGHVGTDNDPYSYDDWINNADDGNEYRIRGWKYEEEVIQTHQNILTAWDLDLYGPWRLQCNELNLSGSVIRGALLQAGSTIKSKCDIENSIIDAGNYATVYSCDNPQIKKSYISKILVNSNMSVVADEVIMNESGGPPAAFYFDSGGTLTLSNAIAEMDYASLVMGGTLVDSGNISVSQTVPAVTWNTVDVTSYDYFPGYGVGATGGWAAAAAFFNKFSSATAVAGQVVTSTVGKATLISKIQEIGADTYFDEESELKSVMVTYRHSGGRQRKTIVHTGSGLTGPVSWSSDARDGTWEKIQIQAYDADGAMALLNRSQIGAGEDLTRTDGTMNLNT